MKKKGVKRKRKLPVRYNPINKLMLSIVNKEMR
jgi:hypothetical protein